MASFNKVSIKKDSNSRVFRGLPNTTKATNQCQKHEQNKGNNEKNACLQLHIVLKNIKESQDKISSYIQPSHLRCTEI